MNRSSRLTDVPLHVYEAHLHPANLLALGGASRALRSTTISKQELQAKKLLHGAFVAASVEHPRTFFTDLYHANRHHRRGPRRLFLIKIYLLACSLCEVHGSPTRDWMPDVACLRSRVRPWATGVKRIFIETPLDAMTEAVAFL